jgi:hypothetical protein
MIRIKRKLKSTDVVDLLTALGNVWHLWLIHHRWPCEWRVNPAASSSNGESQR